MLIAQQQREFGKLKVLLTAFRALPGLTLLSMPDGHISGREKSLPEPHKASGKTTLTRAIKEVPFGVRL